jgi:hypothetical protein
MDYSSSITASWFRLNVQHGPSPSKQDRPMGTAPGLHRLTELLKQLGITVTLLL